MNRRPRALKWVGSSYDDFRAFPSGVQDDMGYALYHAQIGNTPRTVKPLKGFKGAGVVEIVESHDGNAFRAIYTVKFDSAVYVLHAFQKKSKSGIKTPQVEIDLVERRLKAAAMDHLESKGTRH